jgi:hypothetical protein
MTPDERIAYLEAEVRSLRMVAEAQAEALRAANLRLQEEGAAAKMLRERREAARVKKQRQRADRLAVIAAPRGPVASLSPGQSRDNEGTAPLSPPLDGSPLSSKPSLPSPLSSPQSPSASQEAVRAVPDAARAPFALEEQKSPAKRRRKDRTPSVAESLFGQLQELREERCAEVGEPVIPEAWPFWKQNEKLGPLLKLPPEEQGRFESAYHLYLGDDGERVREPAWALSYFMNEGVRAKYETRAAREAA